MTSRAKTAKKPTLFRPGSADYLAWKAERDRTEAPWRSALKELPREKLIELAVAGAWTATFQNAEIERLAVELEKHRQSRRSAVQKSRPHQKETKAAIRQEWLARRLKAKKLNVRRFAHEMVAKYQPVITDVITVERYCRVWEREEFPSEVPSQVSVFKQRFPPPEIYRVLGYFDPEWAAKED